MTVPVIDLFAGPGGLGEGFSKCKATRFDIAVSIEKDAMAFETLRLRSAHRSLARSGQATRAVWLTWDEILASSPWKTAFDELEKSGTLAISEACTVGRHEAWKLELGPNNREEASRGIRSRLRPFMSGQRLPDNSEGYKPENDHRHFLYREYLQVINEFRPAVFIMENVKGILTSRVSDNQMFATIVEDLRRPDVAFGNDTALEYVLMALPEDVELIDDPLPESYIVRAEQYGVPQARHRVVICGVRRDVMERAGGIKKLRKKGPPTVGDVINDLPRLRPELSFRGNGQPWLESFHGSIMESAIADLTIRNEKVGKQVAAAMLRANRQMAKQVDPTSGADRLRTDAKQFIESRSLWKWFRDRPLTLLANHQSRSHMPADLVRYLFVAAHGQVTGVSPRLIDFPISLLPKHKNVNPIDPGSAIFKDRFRVQIANHHSMTITSHIGKDGHAFIHPDPAQCRSLTVREAARLQTFPDSYVFLGNRTSQFSQVGNAVPPYLAQQIAEIVADLLVRARLT
jgi:DNA (cytosine-5)-methyltransferase 1